ncbi:hypothetical protein ABMY35_09295 [Pseudoalteromonas sp. BZB3]|uniref:hypothetical protein n=1 Tax=Pseudoalteromonas sp. BZB3 TaxID=3136670 RepID=UPI0032C3D672
MNRYCFALSLLLYSANSSALIQSNAKPGSVEFLKSACQEYTELYNKKDEEHFLAFWTTSKEESFRAGYCLGAVMHTNKTCTYRYSRSVYQSAKIIASFNQEQAYSEVTLLEQVVCR